MKVNEVFLSCQGEGINSGIPMVFVRLQGCNLHCSWCDTKYALNGEGREVAPSGLAREVVALAGRYISWVCVTGGEPLQQSNELWGLIRLLRGRSLRLEIETNGSYLKPSWYRWVNCWVTDIKCPSSGWTPHDEIIADWVRKQSTFDCLKFVVATDEDLSYVLSVLRRHEIRSGPHVLISPMLPLGGEGKAWPQQVWQFCVDHQLRYSLQTHKIVFGNKRGV
jgi:7-carboxy-7-deazaguanine synthase